MISIIVAILVGALVGWLAGKLMKSHHGFWFNCLLGIVGSALGSALAGAIGLSASGLAGFLVSIAGTCVLIAIVRLILGKKF